MRFACGTRGQGPVPFPTHTSPALVEHSCSWSNITAAAVDDSSLQLDGRGSGELCTDESPTPCVAERACMHASSLSSTVLMLGRSSGRCAQHSLPTPPPRTCALSLSLACSAHPQAPGTAFHWELVRKHRPGRRLDIGMLAISGYVM